jgi:AcrR family transcriptional regulator
VSNVVGTQDGRTARRSKNHELVLDAVLELFTAGNFNPTPEEVATQSGVSLRSVYRYVSSRDQLFEQAIARHLKKTANLWILDEPMNESFASRLDHFLEHRLRLYEAVAASNRASRAFSLTHENVRARLNLARTVLRDQAERQFAPELEALTAARRRQVVATMESLTQLEGLDSMIHLQHLSLRETRETLHHLLTLLLNPSPKGIA